MICKVGEASMIAATTAARGASNRAVIKKVIGLIVVAVVCVAAIIVVLSVLKTFGDSGDDTKEAKKFEGMVNQEGTNVWE